MSAQRMTEEEIASQLRSVIQAAYEPVSATIAVRSCHPIFVSVSWLTRCAVDVV